MVRGFLTNIAVAFTFFGMVALCFSGGINAQTLSPPPLGQMGKALGQQSALPSAPSVGMSGTNSLDEEDGGGAAVNPFAQDRPDIRTRQEIEEEIRRQAFNAAITGLFPMRPGEIRTFMERFDETNQAVEIPVYPYPEPEVVVQTISLDPGSRPPEIKLAVGHVATLTILDITGAPWPIQNISWAGNFEVIDPDGGRKEGHVLRITPMTDFAYGNLSMRLLGLKTPVTFILKTHRDTVHYRFDARIPEYGPNADVPLIEGGFNLVAGDAILSTILDGVPPADAERLEVDGVDGRTTAYFYNNTTYVRTPLTLLSPGWKSSVSSADGMNVYAMTSAPVLLLSDRGSMVRAKLSNGEISDE